MNKLKLPNEGHIIKWFDCRLNLPDSTQQVLTVDKYHSVKVLLYRHNTYGEVEGFIPINSQNWQTIPILEGILYWSPMKFEIPTVLKDHSICGSVAYLYKQGVS